MNNLLAAKSDQAVRILKKLGIDMWMIVARESEDFRDPAIPMVVGGDVVWISFFLFTASGKKVALVGNFDAPSFEKLGHFTEIRGYTQGVRQDLIKALNKFRPKKIAINYSLDNHIADGLPHGLFLNLKNMLKGTKYQNSLMSSETLLAELRAVKLPEEIERVREACRITEQLFGSLRRKVRAGMSGTEIFDFLKKRVKAKGLELSFPPTITIGDKTPKGHDIITDDRLDKGEIFHIDFGVVYKGYCSDMQRLIYLLKDNEDKPPRKVLKAFDVISGIIQSCSKIAKPGVPGYKIDARAREILKREGLEEYQHALGHQLGRFVHDGGTVIAPCWERYGKSPLGKLMEGNIFTLELETVLDGVGMISLEEDVVITPDGGRFLSKPQRSLACVRV